MTDADAPRYTVVRRIARGGMGTVDLATDAAGDRFALKRLALLGTADEMRDARARFHRELDVLGRLDHPAIVPVIEVIDDGGEVVAVMPHLSGGSLDQRVRADGPLPRAELDAMTGRLLAALAAAHRMGVVHRDVSPSNVLFDDRGRAHLADFGIAATADATRGLTRTGLLVGTPGFVSPEQARGEPVTSASDLASLGATVHFAATGRSPYGDGDPHAVLLRAARGRAEIDRDLDRDVRRLLRSLLDPRPERRPTPAALIGGPQGTTVLPSPRRARPGRVGRVATAIAIGVLVAGGLVAARAALDGDAPTPDEDLATPETTACTPLPYRPCGGTDAPNTDGRRCLDDAADYDGVATNGCEAEADDVDGTELVDALEATIVPADDRDEYPFVVTDAGDLGCNNTLAVTLVAPAGQSLRLTVLDDSGEIRGEATSADGIPGVVEIRDPRCFRDDGSRYRARVEPVGSDRSAEAYDLSRTGSF